MIIDCISDLHGAYPKLDGGDLLIVAGDLTARDTLGGYREFIKWIVEQKYTRKIVIGGNHDGMLQANPDLFNNNRIDQYFDLDYLQDSAEESEGLKIWGTPWTPHFCDWYFMASPEERQRIFEAIPNDIDILISHGPPWGIRDECYDWDVGKIVNVGCHHLRVALERIKPKLHVFGHIHEGYGQLLFKHQTSSERQMDIKHPYTICVNASHMDKNYKPVNAPIRIKL